MTLDTRAQWTVLVVTLLPWFQATGLCLQSCSRRFSSTLCPYQLQRGSSCPCTQASGRNHCQHPAFCLPASACIFLQPISRSQLQSNSLYPFASSCLYPLSCSHLYPLTCTYILPFPCTSLYPLTCPKLYPYTISCLQWGPFRICQPSTLGDR